MGVNHFQGRMKRQYAEQKKDKHRKRTVDKIVNVIILIPADVFPRELK